MAAQAGRELEVHWGGQTAGERIACREKGVALGSEPIDITADDNSGWRTLLANDTAERQVTISISGVTKVDTLRDAWFNGNLTNSVDILYDDGGLISGTFHLSSYTDNGAYQDAVTFEAELRSSGTVTYTPATGA